MEQELNSRTGVFDAISWNAALWSVCWIRTTQPSLVLPLSVSGVIASWLLFELPTLQPFRKLRRDESSEQDIETCGTLFGPHNTRRIVSTRKRQKLQPAWAQDGMRTTDHPMRDVQAMKDTLWFERMEALQCGGIWFSVLLHGVASPQAACSCELWDVVCSAQRIRQRRKTASGIWCCRSSGQRSVP